MADKLTIDTPDGRVESECEIVEGTGNLFLTAKIEEHRFSLSHAPTGLALSSFVDRESASQFGKTVYRLLTDEQRKRLNNTDPTIASDAVPCEVKSACRYLESVWAHLYDLAETEEG